VVVFNRINSTAVAHPKKKEVIEVFSTHETSTFFLPTPELRASR